MNVMNIDFRVVKIWLSQWEKDVRLNRTASQVAAVMLNKMREESERRLSRVERLSKEILKEGCALQGLVLRLMARSKSNRGMDKTEGEQLRTHRRRMAQMMKEVEAIMKEPRRDYSIKTGGLLLEIVGQDLPLEVATGPWGERRGEVTRKPD